MARTRGTFNFAANFEVLAKAPLDARSRVENYTDLIDPCTWTDPDNNIWLYSGAIVSVVNDPSKGIYFLSNDASYMYYDAWIPAGMNADTLPELSNIGSGDVSIYDGSGGFRTLKKGTGIELQYQPDSNTIQISSDAILNTINGGVWIHDVRPQSTADNVGDKVTSSDGEVLEQCLSSTQNVYVDILALPGNTNYKPNIILYWGDTSANVTVTEDSDRPIFEGTVSITLPTDSSVNLTVVHEDGATDTAKVLFDTPPQVTSAYFINSNYPNSQSELKQGDQMNIHVVTDLDVVAYALDNYGAFAAKGETQVSSTGTSSFDINGLPITTRGEFTTTPPQQGFRIKVKKSTGTWSQWFTTDSINGTELHDWVYLNNLYPTITFNSITYPSGQEALKNSENATVNHTITNADVHTYTNNSEISISNPNIYESAKNVTATGSGHYNISTNNFTVTAKRSANGAERTSSTVVWISDNTPVIRLSGISTRLISGGNDGTQIQPHIITASTDNNQRLLSTATVTLEKPTLGGTWSGTSGNTVTMSSNATHSSFTATLNVHDTDHPKGNYSFSNLVATSLSGQSITTITGSADYTLGGFVVRTVELAATTNETDIHVPVVDWTKVPNTLIWTFKNLPIKRPVGETTMPQNDAWTINALNQNTTTVRILDKNAADSVTQASNITIQENA